jgi:iron(III) transport system substrate-binding protein
MFIGKQAKNPNAAKLWLDCILSQRGQADRRRCRALLDPATPTRSHGRLAHEAKLGSNVKPIPVSLKS